MPMPTTRYSRFNLRYLASRYAGAIFMLLALGLLAGLAYRTLFQPVLYSSHADVPVTIVPEGSARGFSWNGKTDEWRGWLRDKRDWGLLSGNLRYAVKLAATEADGPPDANLSLTLAEFRDGVTYSGSYFRNRYLRRLAPVITLSPGDLAKYMDFQSLAVIVSDLTPPTGTVDWDFSFFRRELPEKIGTGVITDPDGHDFFFKVFYKLHEVIHGRSALTAHAAWRTAVEEVTTRIDKEIERPGTGGFGKTAQRELFREIAAVPILAANSLYSVNGWFSGDNRYQESAQLWSQYWSNDAFATLLAHGRGNGVASVGMTLQLKPLGFPRDIPQTRISALATATLLNFIAARESAITHIQPSRPIEVEAMELPEAEADFVAELEELPTFTPDTLQVDPAVAVTAVELPDLGELPSTVEPVEDANYHTPDTIFVEMYDEVAAKQQQSLIKMHEEAVKLANVERDAVLRQLYNARAASNRLSHEAITARNRADKLRERYDEMAASTESDSKPKVPQQTQELFQKRDELLQRLITLREYCTEEHPFVRLALRDLRVVEQMLSGHTPDAAANRDAEARATRLANLYLEWKAATSQADSLEERARQHDDAIACLLDEVTNLERCISQREIELAQAKDAPVPIVRVPAPAAPQLRPPELLPPQPVPAPEPVVTVVAREIPKPRPVPQTVEAVEIIPHLVFAKLPEKIEISSRRPDWQALLWGLLGGLILSLLWMLIREIFANRFRNIGEAHRLVGLPVLASLPAFDQSSVQRAAETMKGELLRTRPGRLQFMPALAEAEEPPPEGRRGKIRSLRRRPRLATWLLGLIFLTLAALLYYRSLTGFILPLPVQMPRGTESLSLPSITVPEWAEENAIKDNSTWGDLP